MAFFNRPMYPGMMPRRRGAGLKNILLILGLLFGVYYLNLSFGWIAVSESISSFSNIINALTGVLLIILGLMSTIQPRHY